VAIAGKLTSPQVFGSVVPMTRFVVDCGAVLHLAAEGIEVSGEHELLAPTLLRSQTLSALHEAVHEGALSSDAALERLAHIWAIAEQLEWAETYDAEYVALTQLQADAFVTLDADLARRVEGIVRTATIEAVHTA
jgi:predicted nucleic acid-binding protein